MALEEVVTEHFLARYRSLLDAEDSAFDELEHAFEDGDRAHFLNDLAEWAQAIEARLVFLARSGIVAEGVTGNGLTAQGLVPDGLSRVVLAAR